MISTSISGVVGLIALDRFERRNALGSDLVRALLAALQGFDANDAVGAMVITGSPPAFCAGSDLKELAVLPVDGKCAHERETAAIVRSIAALSKPVIAAVDTYALGGGFMLAVACDVVVSASDARWHLPEVTNGWLPIWGMRALVSRVGPTKARLLSWGAHPIDGHEAHRLGLVDYIATSGDVVSAALVVAEGLAALPREAVATVKAYFEPIVMLQTAEMDEAAIDAFALDCSSATAQRTFDRFMPSGNRRGGGPLPRVPGSRR